MVTATKDVVAYRVRCWRAAGDGHTSLRHDGILLPVLVQERLAPDVATATVELDICTLAIDVWQWRAYVAADDYIEIVSDHAMPADRDGLFRGWVADSDMHWGARDESLTLTAVGCADRLRRGEVVAGRYMLSSLEDYRWYNGLATSFNPDGKPNRSHVWGGGGDPIDIGYPVRARPIAGTYAFTYDGDRRAEYWSAIDAMRYLCTIYNDETWLSNPAWDDEDNFDPTPVVVDVTGMDLWTALAAVGDRAGYDVCERYSPDGFGGVSCAIVIRKRHTGSLKVVRHQAPGRAGTFPRVDLDETNVFAGQLAESTTSCLTRPVVAGGQILVEITVALGQAWDPADLTIPDGGILLPKDPNPAAKAEFVARYHMKGDSFAEYAAAGRFWDANTDGRYSGAPYWLSVPDMADLCGFVDPLPEMPFAPRPMLTCVPAVGDTLESWLEYSTDAGSTWHNLTGYRVLKDSLSVYLTAPNLGDYIVHGGSPTVEDDTLFSHLAGDAASVRMRLTCTIAVPYRGIVNPGRRATAGTGLGTHRWFDRGGAGQYRKVAPGSTFAGSGLPADTTDPGAMEDVLNGLARRIQDIEEDRLIEASLAIEWPDEPIEMTDQITQIVGMAYGLGVNAGPARRYPRVVGVKRHLAADTYSMELALDTERKGGMR